MTCNGITSFVQITLGTKENHRNYDCLAMECCAGGMATQPIAESVTNYKRPQNHKNN